MKILIVLAYIFTLLNSQAGDLSDIYNTRDAHKITHKVYGELGVDLSSDSQKTIENIIHSLYTMPEEIIFYATYKTKDLLEEQLQKSEAQLDSLKKENANIPYSLFLTIFALKQYISHIKEYQYSFSPIDRLFFYVQYLSKYCLSFFSEGAIAQEQQIEDLSQQLYTYYIFELHDILHHYQKLLMFLHVKTLVDLPFLLDVWNTPEIQEKLKRRSQHLTHDIKVQFGVAIILDIAIQAGIIAGANLSTQWVDAADQKLYAALVKEQQTITNDWDVFRDNLQEQQKNALKKLEQTFAHEQKKLNGEYKKSSERLHQAIVYLNQSINLDQPEKRFLVQAIPWDRYFESSVMYTPRSNIQPWFNVFGLFNASNWLFVPEHNSFWQSNAAPLNTPFFWKQPENQKNVFNNDPAGYSIFTEWATAQKSYDIEIDCVINNVTPPFFVGIIFNRGRWISGDPERLWWYRAFGIYASETTSPIKVGFAQQILKLPTSAQETEKIISPLEQIMDINDSKNKTIPINDISQKPLHCTFKVSNQPNKVSLTLIQKDPTQQNKESVLFEQIIDNLDPYIFKYHGIGLIAAGCQANFTIKKPTELVYTQDVLERFEKNKP